MPVNLRNIPPSIVKATKLVVRKLEQYDHIYQLHQEARQSASLELSQARQRLDSLLIDFDPTLRSQPEVRKELIYQLEELATKEKGTYAHPQFFVVGEDSLCFKRLAPGTIVPAWQTLFLRQETPNYSADTTRTCSETELSEPFTVPETVNGHYYAIEVWNT